MKNEFRIQYYSFSKADKIFVTEFGHSRIFSEKTVGPWTRSVYILHFVVNGNCRFSGFDANAGQAFLISKGKLHSFTVDDGYEHYWVAFDGELCKGLFNLADLPIDKHCLLEMIDSRYVAELLQDAFDRAASLSRDAGAKLALSALLSMIPLLMKAKSVVQKGQTSYAEEAALFMRSNLHRDITMVQVANMVNISEKHLCRLFIKRFGMPPQQYLRKLRMEQARQLLTHTSLPVKSISNSVGYKSQSSFSASFCDYFGVSPTKWKTSAPIQTTEKEYTTTAHAGALENPVAAAPKLP